MNDSTHYTVAESNNISIITFIVISVEVCCKRIFNRKYLETTPAKKLKILQKLYELKDLQNSHNKKIAKFLTVYSCSAG